jgi:broad specificity phosphatase PhoE
METKICLIRHGQTDWNNQKLIQGRIDNPLNDTGKAQLKIVGKYLKETDNLWDIIITSPLTRAIESATIVKNELNFQDELIINPNVIEREFGKAEGENICEDIYNKITNDDVEGLEKSYELQARAYSAILDIANKYQGKNILIVTHSHFIKGLFTKISTDFTFTTPLYNASLNYVYVNNNKITKYIFNKRIAC